MKKIQIPKTVVYISDFAFSSDFTGLEDVDISENIRYIGYCTFYSCNKLKNINIKQEKDSISGSPWGETINWNYTGE